MTQPTCKQRIEENLENRIKDLERMYYSDDESERDEFYNYGLSFDYVAPNTFTDQKQGFFRYQLSWGGPSDEFRIFTNSKKEIQYIEYWFLDWFDGSSIKVNDEEIKNICSFLLDGEKYPHEYLEEEKEFEPVNIEYPKEERI